MADWDDDGDLDLPSTHLDDEDYDAFVAREFDARGRVKGDPPIGRIVLVLLAVIAIATLFLTR